MSAALPILPGEKPSAKAVRLLLVEDDLGQAHALTDLLTMSPRLPFQITHVTRLSDALKRIIESSFDVVLLDLTLPDADGLDAPRALRAAAAGVPIVVLTGLDDERIVEENAKVGVQDYLLKGEVSRNLLTRSIRYAIERNRLMNELREMTLRDGLTELYNHRGFYTIAEQQMKVAGRFEKTLLLFFADVDGMKECNDQFGHPQGDLLLLKAARILKKTFRESDVIGRLGGDEFAILSLDAVTDSAETLLRRLEANRLAENASDTVPCEVSFSVGYTMAVASNGSSLDELVRTADENMYAHKKKRRVSSGSYVLPQPPAR